MTTTRGLFWGIFLITLGMVFLGQNYGWFDFDWHFLSQFWPLLIILAGLNLIISSRHRSARIVTTVLLAVTIPLAIVSAFGSNRWDRDRFEDRYDRDDDDDAEEAMDDSDDDDNENEHSDRAEDIKVRSNHIAEPMDASIQQASLKFESGAGHFLIGGASDSLIEANTRLSVSNYSMSVNRDETTRAADIELKLEDDHINLKSGELVNRVNLNLNPRPVWSFNFGVGAGQADFDLSPYIVKSLTLNAGAADINLKLGDKAPESNVSIEAGVASVTVRVPRTVGCQVETEGALNSQRLEGFTDIGGGTYQTPDYGTTTQKLTIHYQGGISQFKVERY